MLKRFPGQSRCVMPSIKTNTIYIGLGSNLGETRENLARAIRLLEEYFRTPVTASSIYRSEPVELLEQPWFTNQVVTLRLETSWRPSAVLGVLKKIESVMGREKTVRYGPRLIDLDLLLFADWVLETENLVIPHPKIEERAFVLQPLAELCPDLKSPRTGHVYADILKTNAAHLSACLRWDQP